MGLLLDVEQEGMLDCDCENIMLYLVDTGAISKETLGRALEMEGDICISSNANDVDVSEGRITPPRESRIWYTAGGNECRKTHREYFTKPNGNHPGYTECAYYEALADLWLNTPEFDKYR